MYKVKKPKAIVQTVASHNKPFARHMLWNHIHTSNHIQCNIDSA